MRSTTLFAVLAFGTTLAGCAGKDTTQPNAVDTTESVYSRVASVVVSPDPASVVADATVQLTATVYDRNGVPMTRSVAWSSSDTAVAVVSSSGVVTGRTAGSVIVTASAGRTSGTSAVTVTTATTPTPTPAPVARVAISPSSLALTTGQGGQLQATTYDASGNVLTGRSVSWSSSNPSVATVSSTGYVSTLAAGGVTITALSEGVSGTAGVTVASPAPAPVASVTVTPSSASLTLGQTAQLSATLRDASGNVLTGRTVTWTSSNGAVASVTADGLVSALGAGSATMTATSEGVSGTASVTVSVTTSAAVDTIYYDGFESGSLAGWNDRGNAQNQSIVTSNVYSGTRALQVVYPAGGDGGWLTRFFMPGYDSAYVRVRVKLDAGWTGGTKLMYWAGSRIDNQWSAFGKAGQCPNGTDFFNAFLYGEVSPQMTTHFYAYYVGMPSNNGCYGYMGPTSNYLPDNFQLTAGVWHTIEFMIKLNTPGQANGSQQFWVDGVLRGSWSGITWRNTTDLRVNSFSLAPNTPFTTSTQRVLWFDDVLVTKQRP